jgi:hypothetical protein
MTITFSITQSLVGKEWHLKISIIPVKILSCTDNKLLISVIDMILYDDNKVHCFSFL